MAVVGVGALAAVLAAGYFLLRYAPTWFGQPSGKLTQPQVAERTGVRTATLAFIGGVVAAVGAVFTALTFRLSRRGQGTERFNKAVELLGHSETNVRIGGIHALGQLARDDPRAHHRAVLEVLVSYIRDRSPWPPPQTPATVGKWLADRLVREPGRVADDEPSPAPLDVKAAVGVLSKRKTNHDPDPLDIDLSKTNLRGVRAPRICLRGAVLSDTQLQDADLSGADLRDADLVQANLDNAILEEANLTKASLVRARLVGAKLSTTKGLQDEDTKLKGAIYSSLSTDWPDKFDADASDAVKEL